MESEPSVHADINVPGYGALNGTPANVPGVEFLQSLAGVTFSAQVSGVSLFETAGFVGGSFVSPANGFLSVNIGNVVVRLNVQTNTGPAASAYTAWGSLPVGSGTTGVGTWLVSSVPEPSTVLNLTCGLLLLSIVMGGRNRGKEKHASTQYP